MQQFLRYLTNKFWKVCGIQNQSYVDISNEVNQTSQDPFKRSKTNNMNKIFNLKSLSLIAIATASIAIMPFQSVNAAAEQEDRRVRTALEEAGVEFTVTNDKTFKVLVKLKDGRTQIVLIDSNTSKINGTNMEFREVYALAHKVKANLSEDISNKMMKESHDKKIGAWEIFQAADSNLAVFTAKVDCNLNYTSLAKIINSVGLVADTMEQSISDKDEY